MRISMAAMILAALMLAACNNTDNGNTNGAPRAANSTTGPADFTLRIAPGTIVTRLGEKACIKLVATPQNGLNADIDVTLSGVPGVKPTSYTIPAGQTEIVAVFDLSAAASFGNYTTIMQASAAGITHTSSIPVQIMPLSLTGNDVTRTQNTANIVPLNAGAGFNAYALAYQPKNQQLYVGSQQGFGLLAYNTLNGAQSSITTTGSFNSIVANPVSGFSYALTDSNTVIVIAPDSTTTTVQLNNITAIHGLAPRHGADTNGNLIPGGVLLSVQPSNSDAIQLLAMSDDLSTILNQYPFSGPLATAALHGADINEGVLAYDPHLHLAYIGLSGLVGIIDLETGWQATSTQQSAIGNGQVIPHWASATIDTLSGTPFLLSLHEFPLSTDSVTSGDVHTLFDFLPGNTNWRATNVASACSMSYNPANDHLYLTSASVNNPVLVILDANTGHGSSPGTIRTPSGYDTFNCVASDPVANKVYFSMPSRTGSALYVIDGSMASLM